MSKFLGAIGKVAGIVATVASFIPGGQLVAAIATAVALVATTASQLLAKKPAAKGQVERRMFGANTPLPYPMGRTSTAGVQVHDTAWGGKIKKVWNPYRFLPIVLACAGPAHAIEAIQFDHATVPFSGAAATGYYADFVFKDVQLGTKPESDALVSAPGQGWGTPPGWGSDYKLSGFAALALSLKFDKEGKIFAQGVPPINIVGSWVKVYDPRLDSTYPGGSGPQRIDDESTWAWSENPALHAIAYGYGRYDDDDLIFGVGLGADGIDLNAAVAWANVCDANGWKIGGTIYESGQAGEKWNNMKLICQAGGCEPVPSPDGVLTFKYQAPRVSLKRIVAADVKGDLAELASGRTWRERVNTIIPRFRSEANQWNYVQATAQSVEAFIAADGEVKEEEVQYDLVQQADQAAELALYDLWQRREQGPIPLVLGPEYMGYLPGDTLTLDPDVGLWPEDLDVVVLKRVIDPLTGLVSIEFEAENPDKHDEVLGATASAPPVVTIPTAEDRDFSFGFNLDPVGYGDALIATSSQRGLTITATDTTIVISNHERVYADYVRNVTGTTLTGKTTETLYYLYYDDDNRLGGAVTWVATEDFFEAQNSPDNPGRHYAGYVTTDVVGGTGSSGGGALPPGSGGSNPYEITS